MNNKIDGHGVFQVDTGVLSISNAISELSKSADITDISVAGATVEEMVVSLYEEFKI